MKGHEEWCDVDDYSGATPGMLKEAYDCDRERAEWWEMMNLLPRFGEKEGDIMWPECPVGYAHPITGEIMDDTDLRIWTITEDCGGPMVAWQGVHFVNRLAYLVTERPASSVGQVVQYTDTIWHFMQTVEEDITRTGLSDYLEDECDRDERLLLAEIDGSRMGYDQEQGMFYFDKRIYLTTEEILRLRNAVLFEEEA